MPDNSKEARAKRLKQLRAMTGLEGGKPLTRAALERKHGLNAHTLKNWEVGHGTGLTDGGARRAIDIYQKEYIDCSISWLLRGDGASPKRRTVTPTPAPHASRTTNPMDTTQEEMKHFKSLHPEAALFEIKDDAMAPRYLPGDAVGGIRHYARDIGQLIDKDCIVETKDGQTWLRRLQNSTVPGQYNLYALNPSSKIERPTFYSVEILTAAPVMRIWRGKKW